MILQSRHRIRRAGLALSVSAAALVAAAAVPAYAQSTASEASEVEMVVVTAQKREENVQDVPAAITVLSGQQIDDSGAVNIEGLMTLVPTLNFRESVSTLDSSIFLRGVGTINFSLAAEPSVAFVLDGVVQARAGEAFGDLYDLERIEVLRGPQGTLFGKNASAGVVNVITRKPGPEFGAYIDLQAYEDEEYRVRVSADVPLAPNVLSRWTAFYGTFDGFIRNITYGEDVNGYEHWGVRGVIEARPTDKLTLTFIGDYRASVDDCCAELIGVVPVGPTAASQAGIDIRGDETRQVRNNQINLTKENAWGLSAQADLDLGDWGVLTSITAYRDWKNNGVRDGDYADTVYIGLPQVHDYGPEPASTFSQELRLASPGGQRLEYVLGLYYYHAEAERTFQRDDIVCTASTLPALPGGLVPCAPGASTLTFPSSVATFGSDIKNMAVFGQGTFNLTDAFRLIFGARFTHDEVSAFHDRTPSPIPGPGVLTIGSGYRLSTEHDDFSIRAGAQYDVTEDLMVYATYAQGYKGPAFNVFFNQNPTQTNVIEEETADSFEGGFKATLLDNRLLFNMAAFYAKYENFQANNFEVLGGTVITRLTNAGSVSTRGAELDFMFRATENLRISGGSAYTDAHIDEFKVPPGSPPGATSRSGERLPLAPEWKHTVSATWSIPLEAPVDLELGAQAAYTSSQVSDLQAAPAVREAITIDDYTVVNLNLAVVDDDGRWRLNFIAKNIFDESFASLITIGGPGGSYRYLIPREAERYFGINLRLNFGAF